MNADVNVSKFKSVATILFRMLLIVDVNIKKQLN